MFTSKIVPFVFINLYIITEGISNKDDIVNSQAIAMPHPGNTYEPYLRGVYVATLKMKMN